IQLDDTRASIGRVLASVGSSPTGGGVIAIDSANGIACVGTVYIGGSSDIAVAHFLGGVDGVSGGNDRHTRSVQPPPLGESGASEDSDGDGIPDAIDLCVNPGGAQDFLATPAPYLSFSNINKTTYTYGNAVLTGTFRMPASWSFSQFDPAITGAHFVVATDDTTPRVDAVLTNDGPNAGWKHG